MYSMVTLINNIALFILKLLKEWILKPLITRTIITYGDHFTVCTNIELYVVDLKVMLHVDYISKKRFILYIHYIKVFELRTQLP